MSSIKKIVRADRIGFCFGVRNAVGTLAKAVEGEDKQVYTLGPIIHNPQVIEKFHKKGVKIEENPKAIEKDSIVVVRAHGVPPQLKEKLQGMTLLDGTCPKVLASQKKVKKYSDLGYQIIIVGDANHGEIKGLEGYAKNPIVLSTPEEARSLNFDGPVMVISQTTIKQEEFDAVCSVLQKKCSKLKIVNSICSATFERQQSLRELCKKVDACLVIGGKNSANTQRLYQTAKESKTPSWHIQDENDIPLAISEYETIGISAGASTPDDTILAVEKRLLEL